MITPGPAVTINTVEGFQNVDAIVGTFTAADPDRPGARAASPPATSPRRSTGATRRPTSSAGTITQDASNPSVYYITGTHTFVDTGTYTVDNTVAFAGGTYHDSRSTAYRSRSPSARPDPTAGTPATATVTQGPLAVSAFPIVGTEGIAIAAAPIATFIDAGGADPIGDYSATINIFDSTGTLVVSVPAASITQNADAAQYTVNRPGHHAA